SLAKLEQAADEAFIWFCALPGIQLVDLNCHLLSAAGLSRASHTMRGVKALSLRYCTNISAESLLDLAKNSDALETLDISYTACPDDEIEELLQKCRRLQFLNCTGFPLEFRVLEALRARYPNTSIYQTSQILD